MSRLYDSPLFLELWPGLWIALVAPLALLPFALFSAGLRTSLVQVATSTPRHWLVAIQILRLAAVGTLIKTLQGDFPLHVEVAIGLTDIAFATSAIFIFQLVRRGKLSSDALLLWHCVGIGVIIVPGTIAIQSNLPGQMLITGSTPVGAMLDFPMVLAPTLVVPVFVMLNALGAWSAWFEMRRKSDEAQCHST